MSADLVELAGLALSTWALGFCLGMLITFFRKLADQI